MTVNLYEVANRLNERPNTEVLSCENAQIDVVVYNDDYRGTTGYITAFIDDDSIKIYKSVYIETAESGFVKSRQIIQRDLVENDDEFVEMITPLLNTSSCIKF